MKNQFVELPISTRDGQFTARYSGKGLAEMDFPNGRAELPLGPDARQRVPTVLANRSFQNPIQRSMVNFKSCGAQNKCR